MTKLETVETSADGVLFFALPYTLTVTITDIIHSKLNKIHHALEVGHIVHYCILYSPDNINGRNVENFKFV